MPSDRIRRLARDERLARRAGFLWGLAEGLFFFIVPDLYISFAALFSARAGLVAWLGSIGGSVSAVVLIYLLVTVLGVDYLAFVGSVPGISAALIARVQASLVLDGLPYTPLLALGGVPLKLYAGLAFSLGSPLAAVLVWTVFARIVRIAPTFAAAAAVRLLFGHRVDARPAAWLAGLGLFWTVFYVLYFLRMSRI